MGRKSRKRKQARRQKYIKKKQEENIPLSKKVVIMIEKTFRYICMAIVCDFVCVFIWSVL